MAERRMFTKKVTDDDNFMSLSASAQALYLHLSMAADDDGFCNQLSVAMFKAHASVQDLEALLSKRYVYQFENGVIVIKHWRMANALRKDRYTPTTFQEELKQLKIKANGSYTMDDGCQVVAERLPDGCQVVATGKDSIGKDSIGKVNKRGGTFVPPTHEEIKTYCDEKGIKIDIDNFLDYYTSNGWMVGKNKMKSWQCTVNRWARMDKTKDEPKKDKFNNFESSQGTDWDEVERRLLDKK